MNAAATDKVFKYDIAPNTPDENRLVGDWTIDGENRNPRGITLDARNGLDLLIVDAATDRVFVYNGAADRNDGHQESLSGFDLDTANNNKRPEGIVKWGLGSQVDASPPVVTINALTTVDQTPRLTGTVDDPNAHVEVTVTSETWIAINNADGTWTLPDNTIDPPLAPSLYDVTVTATDQANNIGTDPTTFELTVIEAPPTKFFVPDAGTDDTFIYDQAGVLVGELAALVGNDAPRGITSDAAGSTLWLIDSDDHIYSYNPDGTQSAPAWKARGLGAPEGIATDGQSIWIVDRTKDKIFFFEDAAANPPNGPKTADSVFLVANGNGTPRGITTDGTYLWVVNDAAVDEVYKYRIEDRALMGSWRIDVDNSQPRGITIDPNNVNDVWIVDGADNAVYHYSGAASRTSGSQDAQQSFPLAATNTAPEGIADPLRPGASADSSGALSNDFAPAPIRFSPLAAESVDLRVSLRVRFDRRAAGRPVVQVAAEPGAVDHHSDDGSDHASTHGHAHASGISDVAYGDAPSAASAPQTRSSTAAATSLIDRLMQDEDELDQLLIR